MISLVLVDDHAIVRQGLRSVLEREADVEVVGEAGSAEEAMRVVAATVPDVVLLDLKLSAAPGLAGLDLCERLTSESEVAVLVLTTTLEDAVVVAALRRGARGYVIKEVDTSELLRAIRTVHAGHNAFDSQTASAMVRGLNAATQHAGSSSLTAREIEVLRLLAQGRSNRDIAGTLFVSESTAKFHVANIMRKLDVTRRAEAVYVASKMGTL